MKNYVKLTNQDIIIKEKTNKAGIIYFVSYSTVFDTKRLRKSYISEVLNQGLYIELNDSLFLASNSVSISKDFIKIKLPLSYPEIKDSYKDNLISKNDLIRLDIPSEFFSEEELNYFNQFIK